eukprot:10383459-Alexandrium_andersonii.AAC.1
MRECPSDVTPEGSPEVRAGRLPSADSFHMAVRHGLSETRFAGCRRCQDLGAFAGPSWWLQRSFQGLAAGRNLSQRLAARATPPNAWPPY